MNLIIFLIIKKWTTMRNTSHIKLMKFLYYIKDLREWAFRTPTRMVELISGFVAFFFSSAFLLDISIYVVQHPYRNFSYLSSKWLWFIMFLLSILQIIYAGRSTVKSNLKSAQLLLWFSLVWIIIAVVFATDYPPISTGFFTYSVLSVVNLISYFYLDHLNKSNT